MGNFNQDFRSWMAEDGSGGAVFVWADSRDNGFDSIYAQRIDSSGAIQWGATGTVVCPFDSEHLGELTLPQIVSAGSGEWIVAWIEGYLWYADGTVYAQKLDSTGATQWDDGGVSWTTNARIDNWISAASDGNEGAFLTWETPVLVGEQIFSRIVVGHVDSSGTLVCGGAGIDVSGTDTNVKRWPQITASESGAAIVAWQKYRDDTDYDIHAQKVDSTGTLLWALGGVPVCTTPAWQTSVNLVGDGNGGSIVTWGDNRNSASGWDIYAQRLGSDGTPQWTGDGVPVSKAQMTQSAYAPPVADGFGGAMVFWEDYRNAPTNSVGEDTEVYGSLVRNGTLLPAIITQWEIE